MSDTYEEVDHPDHYNWHPVCECIEISEHFTANLAKVVEYIWRCGRKPGVDAEKDLRKAIWFLEREITKIHEDAARKSKGG